MSDDLLKQVQTHFVRAGRQGGDDRRNWSLFFFFRILSEAEIQAAIDRALGVSSCREEKEVSDPASEATQGSDRVQAAPATPDQLRIEFANPTLWTLPFVPGIGREEVGFVAQDEPSKLFLSWLNAVTSSDFGSYRDCLKEVSERFSLRFEGPITLPENIEKTVLGALGQVGWEGKEQVGFTAIQIQSVFSQLADDRSSTHGLTVLKWRLVWTCAYEIMRHMLRAQKHVPVLRSAATEGDLQEREALAMMGSAEVPAGDRSPIEIAFTHSGLRALALDPEVLSSFPDAFKDGMAARAARLGDVGESAPSRWIGELGQSAVHGLLSGGFRVEAATEHEWREIRRQIRLFNEAAPGEGEALRVAIGFIFRLIGLEVVHIELGQDPYYVADGNDAIVRPPHRYEHFGFRDGISQPVRDLRVGDPRSIADALPGGGTPAGNESWAPVAHGEIFLGAEDEDGAIQQLPAEEKLRYGATYLVFRKLEQDVGGFRSFLARARPGSASDQVGLASQFVGRWPNGLSLVDAPYDARDFAEEQEHDLNNFRYAAEDPQGRRCPLGAHVRRANPRDTGGRNEAKRHRIQRRGMAYGGPFLAEGSLGDGLERGMLFIALNARIDLQFELIQSRWINGGEFLGQAGLGRCPLTGAHQGRQEDQFLEAGARTPLNGLPAFVRMRGGEYFFAPGIDALKAIAQREKFKPIKGGNPTAEGFGLHRTEDIFSAENLRRIAAEILNGKDGFKPQTVDSLTGGNVAYKEDPKTRHTIMFVGRHVDVSEALSGRRPEISVPHYGDASRRISLGSDPILIATDGGSAALRQRMQDILTNAWTALNAYGPMRNKLDHGINQAIRRTRQVGVIDLVHDLAVGPLYNLVADIYGVPGPNWLTEAALALPFGKQHLSELHPDWLTLLSGRTPANPRLTTLQVWSILCFSDLVGNVKMQEELKALSMQAGTELSVYLEQLLAKARMQPPPTQVRTLVDAFVAIESQMLLSHKIKPPEYYLIVRLLLTELVASALAVIPATFGSVMAALLDNRVNLGFLMGLIGEGVDGGNVSKDPDQPNDMDAGVKRLIYETNRMNPSLPLLQRYAEKQVTLASGVVVGPRQWIGALTMAANFDRTAFPCPEQFSLHPFLPGPRRHITKYLMFGESGSDRECWGKNRLAMMALVKFIRAAATLPGLRRVAGPGGKPIQILRTTIGLPARFARF